MTPVPTTKFGDTQPGSRDRGGHLPRVEGSPLRVLVVQDEPGARVVLATLAECDAGFQIHHVRRLGDAFERVAAGNLEAVLLDLGLPGAINALTGLRAAGRSLAFVGLTTEDDPALRRRAFLEGAEDIVIAPFTARDLCRALLQAIERNEIHAALRLQAEQHAAIADSSILGIVIHQDEVIRYANTAIARLMGYDSPAELIGMSALAHIAPHERGRVIAVGDARRRGEPAPRQYEFEALRRDGALLRLECLVTPIVWEGRPATVSTMIDITERRRNEEALRALADVGHELVGAVGLPDAAGMIVARARDLFGARSAILYRLAPRPLTLVCAAAFGGRRTEDWTGHPIAMGEGLAGRAVAERQAVWTRDALADPRLVFSDRLRALMEAEGFKAGIAVPLLMAGQAMGAIVLGDPLEHAMSPEGIRLLSSFADRAALAIERASLYERAAARAEKLAVLARVSGLIASATGLTRVLEAVARAAISLLGAKAAGVLIDDPAARVLRMGEHYRDDSPEPWRPGDLAEIPYGSGVAAGVCESREPAYIEDLATSGGWPYQGVMRDREFEAYAGLPLVARGRAVGVLSILFAEHRSFSAEERELMSLLADQAAIAMDNARLLQETEQRRSAAEALAEVGRLLAQSLDPAVVAHGITEAVRGLLGVTNTALFRFRPESGDLQSLSLRGEHGLTPGQTMVYPLGQGASGLAAQERRAVVTANLAADPTIPQPPEHRARVERSGLRAVMAVPLIVQGRVVGVLALADRSERRFTREEVQVVEAFATRAAIALETARLHGEIRSARDFLQSIADSSADAIITADIEGRISYWSRGAEELFGHTAAEMLGRPAQGLYAGGLVEARAVMARLGAEGRMRDYETLIRAKGDREIAVSASFSLLRGADGAIAGTLGVMKDMTERKVLEEGLRQAQKMEAVGRLAGGIAHDFNNLITVVITRSQLLLERLRPEDPLRRDIELFWKTAERAAALTRQLLAFSRRQVLQPKVLDVNETVAAMESLLRRLIGEDVELRTVAAPSPWRVKADPGQLEQVIVNLAVNARDAMPEGGQLTIETANVVLDDEFARLQSGVRPGPHVLLAISDTGIGMDAETRAHIFEPFFTTKEPGKGTGLGLSTVYGIVKQSGGHIVAQSEPGRGTTFRIYLPRVEEVEAPPEAEPIAIPRRDADGGTETILLVEDEEDLRGVIKETLEAFGYTLLEARHGGEALRIAERHAGPIDLLVTDVIMPVMNGAELAQRLRPLRPGMGVMFMSGYSSDEAAAQHDGVDASAAYLEKPFSPFQLVRRVREVLNARRR
jgi:PAS domain S-box-containing protein